MMNTLTGLSKEEKYGLTGTILFHVLLLILFILFGLTSVKPPPDSGVLLNFGTSDVGSGEVQPQPTKSEQPVQPTPEQTQPTPSETEQVEEEVMTQDAEETVEVKESEQKEEKKEEQKKVEEKKEDISDELKKTLKDAFDKKNKNAGSEGDDNQAGDKGKPEGTPDGDSYSGKPGSGGNGISYSLGGRDHLSIPKPIDKSQEEGKVVVTIIVDRNGNVVKAIPGARGTTTTSGRLLEKAKDAAMKAKFTANRNAPEEQKGTITYVFILE